MELEEVKSFILERTLKMAEKAGNRLPCGTRNGIYHYKDDGGWTGGFNIGLLNYCYLLSGDSVYLECRQAAFSFDRQAEKKPAKP